MHAPITGSTESMFYLDSRAQNKLVPTFAFRFTQNFPLLPKQVQLNQRFYLRPSKHQQRQILILGSKVGLFGSAIKKFIELPHDAAMTHLRVCGKHLVELSHTMNAWEFALFEESFPRSLHWSLVLMTPIESYQVLISTMNSEVAHGQQVAWHEQPRF